MVRTLLRSMRKIYVTKTRIQRRLFCPLTFKPFFLRGNSYTSKAEFLVTSWFKLAFCKFLSKLALPREVLSGGYHRVCTANWTCYCLWRYLLPSPQSGCCTYGTCFLVFTFFNNNFAPYNRYSLPKLGNQSRILDFYIEYVLSRGIVFTSVDGLHFSGMNLFKTCT